jgi:hypothetical protein
MCGLRVLINFGKKVVKLFEETFLLSYEFFHKIFVKHLLQVFKLFSNQDLFRVLFGWGS